MTQRLTVIIPCKDEQPHILPCIESFAAIADEILIADSGSTDGTLELVKNRGGCRLIERAYINPADFKNWAIPQAKYDWILLVDADERVTPELADEIRRWKAAPVPTGVRAYSIARRSYFLGQEIRYSGWQNDRVRRLFHKSCRYAECRVHEELDVPPQQIQYLKACFDHHTFRSLDHFAAKLQRYGLWGAADLHERGKRASLANLVLRPGWRFAKHYLWQRGILDGKAGLVLCLLLGYSVFLKYAALWELECQAAQKKKQLPQPAFGHAPQPAADPAARRAA